MKKNKKIVKKIFFFAAILLIFFSTLHPIFAQYKNQEKIPGAPQRTEFIPYLQDIINFGFAVIGILALFMLIIGAYQYLMAAGNIGKVDSAKETVSSALLGLILGLCAYIILNKINPDLVNMRAITQISGGGITGGTPVTGAVGNYTAIRPNGDRATAAMAYIDTIKKYAEEKGVPLSVAFGLVAAESSGNPLATSPKGAMGLMQLMPGTANLVGVTEPYNPEQSIRGGLTYLKQMYDQTGSWDAAVAAYNCGPTRFANSGTWENLPTETKNHVPTVMGYANWYTQQTGSGAVPGIIM
ncbi:MAG: hypothetical protein A3J76_06030 [Candidatus Moranbacteria bacterium RBG_13_45_13]|nr:MAG: hypothetical protein A3J76_06030 [Candidatus Moranbacteria bacterium RBG_13_45_13]